MADAPAQQWSAEGVTLRLTTPDEKLARLLHALDAQASQLTLSHAQAAALSGYDANLLSLPPQLEATLIVAVAGRIDHPNFSVLYRLEPFSQSHAWASFRRIGALIEVGERRYRMNAEQYRAFEAIHAMLAAGANVAARLRAWAPLVAALHVPHRARVLLEGELPHIFVTRQPMLPTGAMARHGGKISTPAPDAQWAMLPKRRYFLPL